MNQYKNTNSSPINLTLIIPVFQEQNILTVFLSSLADTIEYSTKIVFINDGAGQSIQNILIQFAKTQLHISAIDILWHDSPRGSGACVNEGFEMVEGEFVIILDSDLILQDQWQSKMRSTFHSNENVGVVGALLIFPQTGGIQHCGVGFTTDVARHLFLNASPDSAPVESFRTQCVIFAFCGIRRELIDIIGPMDSGYFNSYDDFDYQMRIQEAGYGIMVNPQIRAFHWQKSNGIHRDFNRRNNLGRFWRKWGTKIYADVWKYSIENIAGLLKNESVLHREFIGIDLAEIRNDAAMFWHEIQTCSFIKIKEIKDYSFNATRSGEIWLPSVIPSDIIILPYRLLFLVDNFIFLTENYYWYSLRKTIRDDDIILDLYGNAIRFASLENSFWPGSKIRL